MAAYLDGLGGGEGPQVFGVGQLGQQAKQHMHTERGRGEVSKASDPHAEVTASRDGDA
jgi:hypothetical protein